MNKYTWGMDGHGIKHLTLHNSNVVILCVLPNCSIYDCMDDLDHDH